MSSDAQKDAAQSATTTQEAEGGGLLGRILSEGRLARPKDESSEAQARDMISEFIQQVMEGRGYSEDVESAINARIAAIDRALSLQLNEIMHHEEFQKLEASWRGLHHLVQNSETGTMLKIKVFNVSKKDLTKDMEKAAEFDQSALFKKVYEEEFGTFGGAPFGALIGDYEFTNHPQDMLLLEKISNVAASANAPFVGAASAQLFGWDSFTDLAEVRDLAKIFDRTEFAK